MLDQIQSQDSKLRGSEEKLAQAQHIAHLGYWERDLKTDLATGRRKPSASLGWNARKVPSASIGSNKCSIPKTGKW